MCLAIEHALAVLEGGLPDGLGQVALAGAAQTKKCVFALAAEGAGGQVEDQAAIPLRIEVEVEMAERLIADRGRRLLAPPLQVFLQLGPGLPLDWKTGRWTDLRL